MADGKYWLSHDAQDIDDTIEEVQEARDSEASLSARLADIIGDFEADQQRQETEIGAVAEQGAKNLLNVTAQSTGIVTVNADCTLTVSGSSTSNTSVTLSSLWLKKGTYKLSSGVRLPTGVYLSIRIASGGQTIQVRDNVKEVEFTVPSDMMIDRIWLFITANTIISNLTVYPMIRRAEITDDTYAQYAPTNRELYEMILALQSGRSLQSVSPDSLMQAGRIDAEMTDAGTDESEEEER